jgi:hypothetical protein
MAPAAEKSTQTKLENLKLDYIFVNAVISYIQYQHIQFKIIFYFYISRYKRENVTKT